MEFLGHLGAVLALPETIPGSSSDPARCEASCMEGFETQLNFDTAFAMVLVLVFNLVPQKAELLFLVAKLRVSLAGSEMCWQNSVFCSFMSFCLKPHPGKCKKL